MPKWARLETDGERARRTVGPGRKKSRQKIFALITGYLFSLLVRKNSSDSFFPINFPFRSLEALKCAPDYQKSIILN